MYGGAGTGPSAEVKAMSDWSYATAKSKTEITVYDKVCGKFKSYGVGEEFSGIGRFIGTVIHEAKHVAQISRADALLPSNGSDSFRYGWSWNVSPHNHWKKGPDKKWGASGVDDDANTIVDDAASQLPFEPGSGDDENLDHSSYVWWPKTWPLPTPNNGPHSN